MHISIIGAGKMGKDISALLSQSVYIKKINLISLNSNFKQKQSEYKNYIKDLEIKYEKKYEIKNFNKIYLTNDIQVIKTSGFIIETVIEDYSIKLKIIKKINSYVTDKTIFFTNTSSLNIKKLQNYYKYKKNFYGMHFFNPVINTRLIELVFVQETQKKELQFFIKLFNELKKQTTIMKFFPGYIVNRILLVQINEACEILEQQSLTVQEIDGAYKAATNNFKGPFQTSDLIGNDVVLYMLKNLYEQTKNKKFKPTKILKEMVKENKLGNKTNSGFYQNL
jgi:3-hydroxybutyryl-CoA dehydrogenase